MIGWTPILTRLTVRVDSESRGRVFAKTERVFAKTERLFGSCAEW